MDNVKDKYSPAKDDDQKKLVMSNGAFAVCEMLEQLINELRKGRMKNG